MVFHLPLTLRKLGEYGAGFSETIIVTETGAEPLSRLPRQLAAGGIVSGGDGAALSTVRGWRRCCASSLLTSQRPESRNSSTTICPAGSMLSVSARPNRT